MLIRDYSELNLTPIALRSCVPKVVHRRRVEVTGLISCRGVYRHQSIYDRREWETKPSRIKTLVECNRSITVNNKRSEFVGQDLVVSYTANARGKSIVRFLVNPADTSLVAAHDSCLRGEEKIIHP